MRRTMEKYTCDRCKADLPSGYNRVDIQTPMLGDRSILHVTAILTREYSGNSDADLCQECAIFLLSDALDRIRKGQRDGLYGWIKA